MQFSEIKSLKRVQKVNESVGTDNKILDTPAIVDPSTGRTLTIAEAIKMRIFDVRTGEIILPNGERICLEEAILRKLVDPEIGAKLKEPTNTGQNGHKLSLLEVIQRELQEAENGYESAEKRIKVTTTQANFATDNLKSIADAIRDGTVDPIAGIYKLDAERSISIAEAYERGLLRRNETVKIKSTPLCLADAISHGLVDVSGWVMDRNAGEQYRLDLAIEHALILPELREIVDTKNDVKVTVNDALSSGLLNAKTGRYVNPLTKEKLTFIEAKSRQLICKPMTLKDVCDLNLMDKDGKIISPTRKSRLSITEGIDIGVLDGAHQKSITRRDNDLVTLNEALQEGIVNLNNEFKYQETGETMSVPEAVDRGFISSVSQKSIFDIDGFKDKHSGDFVSLNAVLSKNLLVRNNGSFKLDAGKNQLVDLMSGVELELVRPEVNEMMNRKIGVHDQKNHEYSVIELVFFDLIDPKSGYLLDPESKQVVPLNLAIERHLITPEGALLLSSLLNITLTTETVTKTVQRYVTVANTQIDEYIDETQVKTSTTTIIPKPNQKFQVETEIEGQKDVFEIPKNGWKLIDAIQQKVFDPQTGQFSIPNTDRLVSFEECVKIGIINPDSVSVIDPNNHLKISVLRALEKHILDPTGHYCSPDEFWPMIKGIENQVIILEDLTDDESKINVKDAPTLNFENIRSDDGSLENTHFLDGSKLTPIRNRSKSKTPEMMSPEPLEISPGVIYDPSTALVIFTNNGKSTNIIQAVKDNKVDANLVQVLDQQTGQMIPLEEAIRKGMVSPKTGDVIDKSGNRINIIDAVKTGLLIVAGAPLVAAAGAYQSLKMVIDPVTNQQIPIELAYGRGLVGKEDLSDATFDSIPKSEMTSESSFDLDTPKDTPSKTSSRRSSHPFERRLSSEFPDNELEMNIDEALTKFDNISRENDAFSGIINKADKNTDSKSYDTVDRHPLNSLTIQQRQQPSDDSEIFEVSVTEALQRGLLDLKNNTYTDPKTNMKMSIQDAIENGQLVPESESIEDEILQKSPIHGPKLPNEPCFGLKPESITETSTDHNIPLKDESSNDEKHILPSEYIENEDTLSSLTTDQGSLNSVREFNEPKSIKVNEQKIETPKDTDIPVNKNSTLEPNLQKVDAPNKQTENIPLTQDERHPDKVLEQTYEKSLKPTSDSSGSQIGSDFANAAKFGLMALVGAPVLAGMAVADSVKNMMKKSDDSPEKVYTQVTPLEGEKGIKPLRSPNSKQSTFEIIEEMSESGTSDLAASLQRPTLESSASTDKEMPFERMIISDAIYQRKIEPKVCRIIYNNNELPLSVQEALEQEQVTMNNLVDVVSQKLVILLDTAPNHTIILDENITVETLIELGGFDEETGTFVDPRTGIKVNFENFIYNSGVFDPDLVYVKDLSKDLYVPLGIALEKVLIDKNTGIMVDSKTGKRVPFFECLQRQWIIQKEADKEKSMSLEEARSLGILSDKNGHIIVDGIRISIGEALSSGILDTDSISIQIPSTGEIIPLTLAIERGLVDLHDGVLIDPITNEKISLDDAFRDGKILEGIKNPVSLEAAILENILDNQSGKFKDSSSGNLLDVQEAIAAGLIDPKISEIKDSLKNIKVPLQKAIDDKLVNQDKGIVKDTAENTELPYSKALEKKLISTKPICMSLIEILKKEYYKPDVKKILNPMTGRFVSLEDGVASGFISLETVLILDEANDKVVSANEAISAGLLDAKESMLVKPEFTLDNAYRRGYILDSKKPISLSDAILRNFYDSQTGLFSLANQELSLEKCIANGEISTDDLIIHDPKSNKVIHLGDAIRVGLLDAKHGVVNDPFSGIKLSLLEAVDRGIIITSKRHCSLPDAVFKGLYDPKSGTFANTVTTEKLSTERAIKRGFIDPQSTIVNVGGKILPFELSVENGMVDTKRGTITDEYGNKIDFREAFDRGILVEVRKPIGLYEAVVKNIFDEASGRFLDPQSGGKRTLLQAINEKLIDPKSVHMKNPQKGVHKPITLMVAIDSGLIDEQSKVHLDNKLLTLKEAFDLGILSDNKAPISIQRAIHQGIYESQTGKIVDPTTNKKITLHEAMRKYVINPQLPCYFNEKDEILLSLNDCCRMKLIDRREGVFKEPGSNVFIPLSEAMGLGLIVDIESAGFGLYEMLAMKLYDLRSGKFINPVNNRLVTLSEACEDDLINAISSLVKNTETGKYVLLDEAIESKIIDPIAGMYLYPNGDKIDFQEARKRGLIVSSQNMLAIESAVKMQLYRPESGKFVDPSTNEHNDLQMCIDTGLLDSDTTVLKDLLSGQDKPIKLAIEQGDVDINRGRILEPKSKRAYNIDAAFSRGLLVTVQKPITGKPFGRNDSMDNILKSVQKPARELSLEDAIKFDLIDPDTAVIKDPKTGNFRILKLAIDDQAVDLQKKTVIDPKASFYVFDPTCVIYKKEPVSFENAIESGRLNLSTGKFTNPDDQAQCTLKEAITLGLIDPESALIKDGAKNKLIRLPEAFRKGLIDSEKFNVVDTSTSKLVPLQAAVDCGLVTTPKRAIDLLEALQYNLYNPTTGHFTDPFITTNVIDRKKLNLNEAIASGLIDPSTTMARDSDNSTIAPLNTAISTGLIDAVRGQLTVDQANGTAIDFIKAKERGLLLPAGERVSGYAKHSLYISLIKHPLIIFNLSHSFHLFQICHATSNQTRLASHLNNYSLVQHCAPCSAS